MNYKDEIKISSLEKVIINTFSPLIYLTYYKNCSYNSILKNKEWYYKRLIEFTSNNQEIPNKLKNYYYQTPCGNLAITALKIRRYFL